MSKIKAAIGLILALAAVVGICFQLDRTYAKTECVEQLAFRLDQKILADRAFQIRERIYQLEKLYPGRRPAEVDKEIRYLKHELAETDSRIKGKQ